MVQAAFEFSPLASTLAEPPLRLGGAARTAAGPLGTEMGLQAAAAASPQDLDAVGVEVGWDHAHYGVTPPLRHLHDHNPVRQGWDAGRAAFGRRTLTATAAVRQWLALRVQAWQHGQAFEDVQVNPHFLARIDAVACPVSRVPLTLYAGLATDATVTRLNTGAAYAAGNLAVLSQRVARLQAGSADQAAQPAQPDAGGALSPDEQARWDTLASFATPLPHAQAALLPLRVLPPNRVRVINPVQALQVMLTLQFLTAGYARRLLGLAVLMPSTEVRQAFQIFMHTLLARRLSAGQDASAPALRLAIEDAWADVLVNRRWQRLATRLTAADCELLLQRASQRGWVVGGGRWVSADSATEGWALDTGSSTAGSPRRAAPASSAATPAVAQADAKLAGSVSAGSLAPSRLSTARSLGSQKLAS